MSLISLNNEHLSSSVYNTNKISDFSITDSSILAVTVSSIKVSHNVNNSISPVITQKLLSSTARTNSTSIPEPKIQNKNTEQIIYMQPVDNAYGKTSQLWFGEKKFITKFDKRRKNLEAYKTRENLNDCRNIIAEIELKLVCKKDILKGKFCEPEMRFLQESYSNSIYPNNNSALADKDDYNNIIVTLKYLKIVKKEMTWIIPLKL